MMVVMIVEVDKNWAIATYCAVSLLENIKAGRQQSICRQVQLEKLFYFSWVFSSTV